MVILLRHVLHVMMIDQVDDLHVPWQHVLQHGAAPALQGLWQNGVVGVGAAFARHIPSLQYRVGN